MTSPTTKNIILLLTATLFLYFSNGRFSFAPAAWLYPVFMLQVSRKSSKIYSCLIIPLIVAVCSQLSFWKFTYDDPSNILFFLPFILGLLMGLLFFIDRLLYSKVNGFSSTLIFPFLYTSFDFSLNLFNPFGTLGVLAYSQHDFLCFSQLASVTGIWGLTFMITWSAAVVYWVIDGYQRWQNIRRGITIYLFILLSVLVYGSARLNIPLPYGTVRIAGIHTHDKNIEGKAMRECLDKQDSTGFKRISDTIIQRLIQATINEANAGSRIIVWSEISPKILKKDEDSLFNVFKALAKQQKIYLVATPFTIAAKGAKSENKIWLFSPKGSLLLKHYKYGGNFMEGTVEGDKMIKAVSTEYGTLSAIICWDGDFPSIVKQVGQLNTDILFIPASDWKEIDPAHSIVSIYRGIENGCSVVRQTRNGLSIMTDARGKIIAQMDHFETHTWITVGQVPTKKRFTLYPMIGDLFGWFSFIGLACFILKDIYARIGNH